VERGRQTTTCWWKTTIFSSCGLLVYMRSGGIGLRLAGMTGLRGWSVRWHALIDGICSSVKSFLLCKDWFMSRRRCYLWRACNAAYFTLEYGWPVSLLWLLIASAEKGRYALRLSICILDAAKKSRKDFVEILWRGLQWLKYTFYYDLYYCASVAMHNKL